MTTTTGARSVESWNGAEMSFASELNSQSLCDSKSLHGTSILIATAIQIALTVNKAQLYTTQKYCSPGGQKQRSFSFPLGKQPSSWRNLQELPF